jgi:catechol 2,3-dioxygenase-like lactoylglutathione lyase family enzyme
MSVRLEHVNVTVSDPEVTAAMLCAVFDWKIRWRGPSQMGGHTIHVGLEDEYLAVYSPTEPGDHPAPNAHRKGRPLNHIGVVVPDLASVEARVRDAGLEPFGHGDYEPGRRFYFFDRDGIEFEVVSYG